MAAGKDAREEAPSRLVALALAVAVALYLWRLIGPFAQFPGTPIDARFNQAVLEHLWLWARGTADSLADTEFFYPYRDTLYLSDTHFGSGLIYVALRALGAPREVAFDGWYLAGLGATFAASLYAFRRLGLAGIGAGFAAVAFTFSLPALAQDSHAQLVCRFAVPMATLAAVRFARAPGFAAALALALWAAWQFLCSVYLGVFLCEWLAFVYPFARLAPVFAHAPARPASAPRLAALFSGAALATALAGYMLWRHADIARAYAIHRDLALIAEMTPHWASLLSMDRAPSVGWLSDWLPHHSVYWDGEHQLFAGPGVLILAALGAVRAWREREMRATVALCAVAALALMTLYLDVGGFGLYRWISQWPGLNAVRSPGRVALVAAFPLAWLAGFGVGALGRETATGARALALAGVALALADIAGFRSVSVPIEAARARIAAVTQGLDGASLQAKRAVLLRFVDYDRDNLDTMLAAQDLGVRTVNGYSGSIPPLYRWPKDCAAARAFGAELDALPFKRPGAGNVAGRIVVVPPGACPAQ